MDEKISYMSFDVENLRNLMAPMNGKQIKPCQRFPASQYLQVLDIQGGSLAIEDMELWLEGGRCIYSTYAISEGGAICRKWYNSKGNPNSSLPPPCWGTLGGSLGDGRPVENTGLRIVKPGSISMTLRIGETGEIAVKSPGTAAIFGKGPNPKLRYHFTGDFGRIDSDTGELVIVQRGTSNQGLEFLEVCIEEALRITPSILQNLQRDSPPFSDAFQGFQEVICIHLYGRGIAIVAPVSPEEKGDSSNLPQDGLKFVKAIVSLEFQRRIQGAHMESLIPYISLFYGAVKKLPYHVRTLTYS